MARYTNKEILKITFPVLVSLLMEQMIGLTDTIYLGHYGDGQTELGASALAGVFYMVIFMLGFGFSVGAQVLIARRNGEGRYREIGPIFMQGTLFLLLLAAVLFTLSQCFARDVFSWMIGTEAVRRAAGDYLEYRVYGFFFSFTALMFRAFYVGTTRTRILTTNSVVMVLTNILLNYLLIYGKGGFPEMGIAGAAIASSVAEGVSVLFFAVYTYFRIDWRRYRLFRFRGFEPVQLRQILRVSVWIMLQEGMAFLSWFIFFVCIEHLGAAELAVTNMVRSISSVVFLFVNAFASTASSLVSNLIGSGEADAVMPLCRRMTGALLLLRRAVGRAARALSLGSARALLRQCGAGGPRRAVHVGDAVEFRRLRAGFRLPVLCVRYGQHAHDTRDRAGGHRLLCRLHGVAHLRTAGRCRRLLDDRPPLLLRNLRAVLSLHARRTLADAPDLMRKEKKTAGAVFSVADRMHVISRICL